METKTVLVVDDDTSILRLITQVLRMSGYAVLSAGGAREAQAAFDEAHGLVDLVIADVIMPARNGPELVRDLRSRNPGLGVLFISGYVDMDLVRAEVVDKGHPLLAKPFSITNLLHKVREIIGEPRITSAGA